MDDLAFVSVVLLGVLVLLILLGLFAGPAGAGEASHGEDSGSLKRSRLVSQRPKAKVRTEG
jgi:hypothetical protein